MDVAAVDIPDDDVGPGRAQPVDDRLADTGSAAGDYGVHAGGPITSTRTPSGAVITAIATFLPPGAGISIRRTPSSKPRPASVARVASTSRCRESRKKPNSGAPAAVCAGRAPSRTTSSTMPVSGAAGSPRK